MSLPPRARTTIEDEAAARALLRQIEAVVADMDGVLWVGERPLPGLADLFSLLSERRLPYVLATNNASRTPGFYVDKLEAMGVSIGAEHVLTSALAAADWLRGELPQGAPVFVVGQDGLRQALRRAGLAIVDQALERPPGQHRSRIGAVAHERRSSRDQDPSLRQALPRASDRVAEVAAVVVGIDFELTYEALRDATLLIRRGARFVGTNADLTYPSELGLVPGAGAILAAIQAATGTAPTVIGKPEPHLFDAAVARLARPRARTVMIGDRLDTDILGARRAGLRTILVTTGVDRMEPDTPAQSRPDLVVSGLDELVGLWRSAG